MAIMTSGQPESGQIIFCWIWFSTSDLVPERMLFFLSFFCTGSGLDHHYCQYWIWIRFVFVHLAWFQYQCIILDPLGLNEARSEPPSGKTDWGYIQHFYSGQVVITWSESDPVFAHLTLSLYRCIIQDPLGLNKARSDRLPAKQIGTTSGISIQGQMVIAKSELNPIRFLYILPGSASIDALFMIRLDWTKQDLICIFIIQGRLLMARSESEPFTSGPVPMSVALSRQDPFAGLNELRRIWPVSKDRSGLYPAFLFKAGCSWPDLNLVDLHFGTSGPVPISMSYPGFDEPVNRRSQIRLILLWQNRVGVTGIRHFQSGPDCHHRPVKTRSEWLILLRQNHRSGSLTFGISIQGRIVIAGLSRLADTRVFYFSVTHSNPLQALFSPLPTSRAQVRCMRRPQLCFDLHGGWKWRSTSSFLFIFYF